MGLTGIYDLHLFPYVGKVLLKRLFSAVPRPYRVFKVSHAVINLFRSEQRRIQCMKQYKVIIPVVCIFSVTHQCNLECKGCYARIHPNGGPLSINEIGKIIRNIMEYGTSIFVITGGEPLLVKDLIPTLGKIRRSLFYLFTNGLLLDEDKIRQLHSCLNIMPVISFEGTDDFTESRRGQGTAS
jgi:MoaA/NifB/PqqE/SkfB family radical SAM enzyme